MIKHCAGGRWMALAVLLLPAATRSADWSVTPTVRLRESYSDNINLAPPAQAQGEFSTEVAPGVLLSAIGTDYRLHLDYAVQALAYSRRPTRLQQQLSADGHAALAPDWLYLDAHSSISQQNVSAFGPQLTDSSQLSTNSRTVRGYSISPYLFHYLRGLASIELRHGYSKVSSGKLLDAQTRDSSLRISGDPDSAGWNWSMHASRSDIDDTFLPPVTMSDTGLSLSHPIDGRLAGYGTAGYEKNDYHATGAQPQGRYWSLGLQWKPSLRTSIDASFGRRYFGNTYHLDAHYQLRRLYLALSYNEDITTSQAQFLSVPPGGLSDFLYQLWEPRFPDPQQRLQQVRLFLAISQLLGTSGNVNYFSHRYFLQKQARASALYATARGTVSLGLSSTGRTAQTSSSVDSILLGPEALDLQDRTRQNTIQLGWNWRVSPRTDFNLGASRGVVKALATGRSDSNDVLAVGLSRQLQPRLSASIDLRHSRHHSNAGGNYRENGISATLIGQF